jgi:plasmid stabilization system protein ParE
MKVKIIWSEPAKLDYWNNIDYLIQEWSEKVAKNFINKVDMVINIITLRPKIFKLTSYKNIRQVPITPHITLYYQLLNDSNVELVRFWNNLQDPEKLKL